MAHNRSSQYAQDSLQAAMAKLHEDRENADFTLVCGDQTFKAHSFILSARSPFFKTALESQLMEKKEKTMEIHECSPEVLTEVIRFMYGIGITISKKEDERGEDEEEQDEDENYQEKEKEEQEEGGKCDDSEPKKFSVSVGLLEIAERFLMEDLKKEAGRFLAEFLNHKNYMRICQIAEKFNSDILVEKCSEFILCEQNSNVPWEEIQKLPKLNIKIMKISNELILAERQLNEEKNFDSSIKLLDISNRLKLKDRKEASLFLATHLSNHNSRYLKVCQLAEKHNAELLTVKCAHYILCNEAPTGGWDWSVLLKLPKLTKSLLRASNTNMDTLRNTFWLRQNVNNTCKCYSTELLEQLKNKLNM